MTLRKHYLARNDCGSLWTSSWCTFFSNYGPDEILSSLKFSHICGHEVFLHFSITYSGIDRKSNMCSMKPRLVTVSFKRCPHVQQTMPSLQYDRHALHCVLGSVSNNSNSSTMPTSLIFSLTSYGTGCGLCLVVDRVEEKVGDGGSRSSWPIQEEHKSSELVSQQNVAIHTFWSQCSPRAVLLAGDLARDLRHGKQRVYPFYHDLFRLQCWSW